MTADKFVPEFLTEISLACGLLQEKQNDIENAVELLVRCRENSGRLFVLGVGGSAATASHAVNDFRKIAGIETYAPTDNVAELTARTNDDGWASVFTAWLMGNNISKNDVLFVFSVGGGDVAKNISANLVSAMRYMKGIGAKVIGAVGKTGGATKELADACILIPVVNKDRITPHTESMHGVVLHLLVSHPLLKRTETKWEATARSS